MSRKKHEQEKAFAEQRERVEAEAHDQRIHEFYTREEARHIRSASLRAALLGGLLATIGSIAATVMTRWLDRRPVVNINCDCEHTQKEKEE